MNEYCANLLKNKTFVNSLQQSIGEKQVEAGIMYRALRSALFESINDSSLTLMKKTFDFFIREGIIKRIYGNTCKYTIALPLINNTFEEHSDSLSFLKELYKITWEETDPLCWQNKNHQTIQKHFIFSAKDKNEAMYIATNKLAIVSYKLYKFNLDKMDFIEINIFTD